MDGRGQGKAVSLLQAFPNVFFLKTKRRMDSWKKTMDRRPVERQAVSSLPTISRPSFLFFCWPGLVDGRVTVHSVSFVYSLGQEEGKQLAKRWDERDEWVDGLLVGGGLVFSSSRRSQETNHQQERHSLSIDSCDQEIISRRLSQL